MGVSQKDRAVRARSQARRPSYEEEHAARLGAKLTKSDLLAYLLKRERVIAEQLRALQQLRADLASATERADAYRDIDRAVNLLAHLKRKAGAEKPGEHRGPLFGGEARSRVRSTTHPQALSEVLDGLAGAVEELRAVDEARAELAAEVEAREDDRRRMLAAIGCDEVEWEHQLQWRYRI